MIETTVVYSRIWWVNYHKVTSPEPLHSIQGVVSKNRAGYASVPGTHTDQELFSFCQWVPTPRLQQISRRGTTGLKRLSCMPWGCCTPALKKWLRRGTRYEQVL